MGRYLRGTKGFEYKYIVAEQPDNLVALGADAGIGIHGLIPRLVASGSHENEYLEVACMPLLRMAREEIGPGGELGSLSLGEGEITHSETTEFIQYGLGEAIVVIARELDAQLTFVPERVHMLAFGALEVRRSDWPTLFAYVEAGLRHAKSEVKLASLDSLLDDALTERAWQALRMTWDGLPAMGLWILRHAVRHDLESIEIEETDASREAERFWNGVREWGPDIFRRDQEPNDVDELFARGFVFHCSGEREVATRSFRALGELGDPRAARWLLAHGVSVPESTRSLPSAQERSRARRRRRDAQRELRTAVKAKDGAAIARGFEACAELGLSFDQELLGPAVSYLIRGAPQSSFAAAFQHADRIADPQSPCSLFAYNMSCLAGRIASREGVLRWARAAIDLGEKPSELLADADLQGFVDDPRLLVVLKPALSEAQIRERLLRVDWSVYEVRKSRVLLMQEFLRRMDLWSRAYQRDQEWPFFDAVSALDANAPEPAPIELPRFSMKMSGCIRAMLRYAAYTGKVPALPHPYEPLLLFFERGGLFSVEQKFIDVAGASIPYHDRTRFMRKEPFVALDPALLDEIDRS